MKAFSTLPASLRQAFLQQTHTSPTLTPSISLRSPASIVRRYASTQNIQPQPSPNSEHTSSNGPLVPPPGETSGPLLTRLPNRALPNIRPGLSASTRTWLRTLPIFIALCAFGSLSIFNYQKSSSSTVSSILYALRTSPAVREVLGNEIYFASRIPWISGELNQLHGSIDISFWVKGTKGQGLVKFVSVRRRRDGFFETLEWSLKTDDGQVLQLLELEGSDPMRRPVPQNMEGAAGAVEY